MSSSSSSYPVRLGPAACIALATIHSVDVADRSSSPASSASASADVSWFIVLFFFIFILSGSFRTTLDSTDTVAYATAVASALLFFVSLVLHELGHALVARRLGIDVLGIDLWFFGGIAKMSRDTDSPGAEFKVAVAGPIVTLFVVALCVGIGSAVAGWNTFVDAATLRHAAGVTPALVLLGWLASINAFVFVFNLIPAFPMDGGRIARAIAWRVTGDRLRATKIAAALGQAFSVLLICGGLFQIIAFQTLWPLWYVVLGLFLGQAARGAVVQTAFAERLGEVKVEDIMDREPVAAPAELDAERVLDEFFHRYRWSCSPSWTRPTTSWGSSARSGWTARCTRATAGARSAS